MTLPRGNALLWMLLLVLVGGTGSLLLSQQAKRFSSSVADVEEDRATLIKASQELQTQVRDLQATLTEMTQRTQTLTVDRDNLLGQAKRLLKEKEDLTIVTDLHERVLKQTTEEKRALRGRLVPLEEKHAQLQQTYAELMGQRDALTRKLEAARAGTEEQRLRKDIAAQQIKLEETTAALEETTRQLAERSSNEAKLRTELPKVQGRLETLEEQYTEVLSQNKTLKFRMKHFPGEVTTIAREHERLLKDLADTHYNTGVLFAKSGDYPKALKEFVKVIELRPKDGDAHYNLGLIYTEHLPDHDKAMEAFRQYLAINPSAKDASWVKQYIASWRAWNGKEQLE